MKRNTGKSDRFIRLLMAAAAVLVNMQFVVPAPWNIILWVFGGVMVITSFAGYCPLYSLFGISTCQKTANGQNC